MTSERNHDPILWSTIAIALLIAVTAVAGIFWPATYARETAYTRAGAVASDMVDLFLIVPVLLISGIRGYRGSVPARLVWLGAQGYLLYNFVIYAFGVHFNAFFLVYSATLGLCFYATVFSLRFIPAGQIAQAYRPRAPRKTIAILFFLLALSTAAFDLREDLSAILSGRVPQSIADTNEPVNFVHVLDLVFLLPALCISATLLWRRRAAGYALAPVFLALLAIMSVELATIVTVMGRAGFGLNVPMIVSFVVLAVVFTVLLRFYFSSAKPAA
ncbi:MAG TPA: hypothetical protein VEJ47_20710 [Candidatus Eremiobacteraceae bacterium]|nr:hypothetical protein [Candidatus Eremiobacteraceae bacterium]